jgi:hypothetical protein
MTLISPLTLVIDIQEYTHGPSKMIFKELSAEEKRRLKKTNQDADGDGGFNAETLREYELQKLKYYYAVAECDSLSTSTALYNVRKKKYFFFFSPL